MDEEEYFTISELVKLRQELEYIKNPTEELTTAKNNLSNAIAQIINTISQD